MLEIEKFGFCFAEKMPDHVHKLIEAEIIEKIIEIARANSIKTPTFFDLKKYHEWFPEGLHSEVWPKQMRFFDKKFLASPDMARWFDELCESAGKSEILDIEGLGYPEVYFRIVRPTKSSDILGPHADGPFFTMANKIPKKKWKNWLKVWSPIKFEGDYNTLGFFPGSMDKKATFVQTEHVDKPRPQLVEDISCFGDIVLPVKSEGDVVLFSPEVLHSAYNRNSTETRISIEFAIG